MTARERLKQQVDKDRIERGSPALSARERLRQKVEQDRTAISTRATKAEQGVSPSAPAVATDNTALINEGKRLQGNVERAKTELYQSGGQREYEDRLRAAETAYQNWWNANPDLHETVGRKATVGEEVDYQAGKFLKGLGSAVQGTIGFVDKLVGDDLAILGSLVDATTGGKTQLEKPIQQWADNALKTDILGADKFGQNVENSMAGIKPSKARDFVGGISESAGAMLPAIATSGIAGAAGLGAGTTQTLNYLTFGSGAAGNAAKQALAEGADMSEAVEYGMMSGMLEVLSESMFAGIAGMNPSGVLDDVMKKLTQNGTIQFLGNTLGEGVEEAVVEFLTPYIQRATYDPDAANTTFAELAKSFASGAAMSFLMTGANAVASGDPASVLRGTKGTAEQEVLQDEYGRVEEQQVSDVFRSGALMPDIAENRPVETAGVPIEEVSAETANEQQGADIEAARAKLNESVMNSAKKVLGEEGYKAFEEVTRDVDNPADYFGELTKAYNAGLANKRGDSEILSATQYSAMFEAGRTDAVVSIEEQAKAKGFATVYGKESGLVYDSYVVNNVNEKTAKVINSTAKLLGIRVRFVDSVAGGSANAQIENGDMLIEKGNPNPLRALFAHEITHRMQELAPAEYAKMRDGLKLDGDWLDAAIKSVEANYARYGRSISSEAALDEVVADYVGTLLEDEGELERFIRRHQDDRTVLQKLRDIIREIIEKLKGNEQVKQLRKAEQELSKVLDAAVEQAKANTEAQKNAAQKSDGVAKFSFKGYAPDGRGIYESNFPMGTPKAAKAQRILNYIQNVWSKKPISLVIHNSDGSARTIEAQFDPTYDESGNTPSDASKLMGGNRHGTASEKRVTLDLADDYYQIASEAVYNYSKYEEGKSSLTHDGVKEWHYFINDILFQEYSETETTPYRVTVNVKEKDDGSFIYSFNAERQDERPSTRRTLHADVNLSQNEEANAQPSGVKVPQKTPVVKVENVGVEIDTKTKSASPGGKLSLKTWNQSSYVKARDEAAEALAKTLSISQAKAAAYIDSVNSIAKMIADDRVRLDYEASPGKSSFVSNAEYGGSIDFSTICKKRRLFTGTFEAIQAALPNTALTAEEFLEIRNMMAAKGYEVSCGLCYVEGSRANMGQYTKQFIERYKATNPPYVPNMAEMNTATGQEKIRREHPEVYEAYEYFMNHYGRLKPTDKAIFASQQKPKMYQLSTEYQGEILDKFGKNNSKVAEKNTNGGLRIQSFSDFEIIHLIDSMQVIMDMSRVGLAGQAYTKVPDFAWALGDTGLKINLSLIAKGVDSKGRLILDETEGMSEKDAMALRERYSENVGTIIVVFTDRQLKAAMADERIDYIIPFHRSQWKTEQYEAMGLPKNTKDFTNWQNEAYIEPVYNKSGKKQRPENYMPNAYWDFSKTGKENAEAYLKMCAENNRRPKFHYLLVDNGNGSYSLQPDGSTDGYWKTLIDFKMYDNEGNGVPQRPVRPEFNMEQAERMLNEYAGGHNKFPAANDVVDEFVEKYKAGHEGAKFSLKDQDYLTAVENGDMDTAQRMVDEAAKAAGYNPVYRYHQTSSRFNRFSNANPGAGLNDSDTPNGYFFKDNDHDIGVGADFVKTGHGGNIQMRVFLKHENLLRFANREEAQAWYAKNVPGYGDLLSKYNQHLRDFEKISKENTDMMFDELIALDASGRSTPALETEIIDKYDKIVDEWIDERKDYSDGLRAKMRSLLDQYFIENDSGYDGIELEYDGHRYIDMKREDVHTFIVFDNKQIKSAEPVTYDDNGNVIPLSERFNAESNDIRFSLKDSENLVREIARIQKEGAKNNRSEAEINADINAAVKKVYTQFAKDYGTIEPGERPAREVAVPEWTDPKAKEKVSQTVRTIMEAGATPDSLLPELERMVATREFSYTVYSDKAAKADADAFIISNGWNNAYAEWSQDVKKGVVSKKNTAIGWTMFNNAVTEGDTASALDILTLMVGHQRNAAQAVQATRILKQLGPSAELYGVQRSVASMQEELNERYGNDKVKLEIDPELAEKLMNEKDSEKRDEILKDIYRDIGRQMPSTFRDKWNAWRYLAMLGNPRTHVRNILGNAFFMPVVAAKDLTATAIEAAVSKVSGGQLTRSKRMPGKALLSAAWGDYAKVSDQMDGTGKYSDFANANKYIEEGRQVFKSKLGGMTLEKARRGNSALLEREDAWFSQPHYAFALAQYCKANGITEEQIRSGKGKAMDEARGYAIREARKATYRDTNALSQFLSKRMSERGEYASLGKKVNVFIEGVLPFRRTPANILVRGLEYSPLGLLGGIKKAVWDVRKGKSTGAEAIDSISAGLTGTGLLALGAYLAAQGLIRGSGGGDKKEREFEELMGHQVYSLELPGGKSITLDWLAPEALPFFVGVNMWEQTQGKVEEISLDTMLSAVGSISEPLLEMSCLQSLNDLFDAVGYASNEGLSGLPSAIASAVTSYITQALPTIGGQIERTGENIRYTTYTEAGKFLTKDMQYTLGKATNRIPGIDYQQIPYIDAWGRTESSGSGIERAFNNFLNPAYTSNVDTSAMEEELLRLYEQTGEAGVFPSRAARYFTVDGERKDLTAEEYVAYATAKGQRAYELVADLVTSKAYKAMSDSEKVKAVREAYDLANQIAKASISDYETDSWISKAMTAERLYKIPVETYIGLRSQTAGVESLKDKNGDTIENSASLLKMQIIYNTPGLTDKQRQALFDYFGVGKKVRHYNKALVDQKIKEMRKRGK